MSRIATILLSLCAVVLGVAAPAVAATTTAIGDFEPLEGSSTSYSTSMQLPATGFPQAAVTSTSRSGQVGVQSGASTWFGENSPVGLEYGSSRNRPYLNLRPQADSASSPSITRYAFERPTPAGWAFVLGDIDADQVQVSATTATGDEATAAELGFRAAFNLCATSPRPSGCSSGQPQDLPSWSGTTRTLTGNDAATDTYGAAGWFEPTVPLRSLTFTFTRRSGFPVYQTWFAVKRHDVTGTVAASGDTCGAAGVGVRLLGGDGAVLAETTTNGAGDYSFEGVASAADFRVELADLPDGCIAEGATSRPVDLTDGDDQADFAIRAIVPVPISGTVTDDDGAPIGGAEVTIDGPGGPRTVTTDSAGRYLFDTNPAGTYSLEVAAPAGYTVDSSPGAVTIEASDTEPVTDRDFILAARPAIGGAVTDGEGPVAGVTVVLTDAGGTEVARATTDTDGRYTFPRLPDSDYSVTIPDPPAPYRPVPARTGVDPGASDVDFVLSRPGSIGGTVTDVDSDDPVPGATITITGPGDYSEELTTDAEGNYAVTGLDPGTYTIVLTPPDGTQVAGDDSRTRVVPEAGGDFGAENFTVVAEADQPGDPGDDGDDGTDDGAGGEASDPAGDAVLPDTGGAPLSLLALGVGFVVVGTGLVGGARLHRRA